MSTVEIISSLLKFIAGLGAFLTGMSILSSALEGMSAQSLKKMFKKITNNRYAGVGVGAATTALVQSSSATTVLVIGFVNAGYLSLFQATSIIIGSNIGTTITALIIALGMISSNSVSIILIFACLCGFGAFISMFTKKDKLKSISSILVGIGILFIGMILMSDSMDSFSKSPELVNFLKMDFINVPILLILVGCIITGVIQSSATFTGIALSMLGASMITLNQAIYLVLGANIGTCVTGLIACIGQQTNAKRTALIHLLFNIFGVLLFYVLGFFINYSTILEKIFVNKPEIELAAMHMLFNIIVAVIILPFVNPFVKLVELIIPNKVGVDDNYLKFKYLSDDLLVTPPMAIIQLNREIIDMAETSISCFNYTITDLIENKAQNEELFRNAQKRVKYLTTELPIFISNLSSKPLDKLDLDYINGLIIVVNDLQRITAYSENLFEYQTNLSKDSLNLSKEAISEIIKMKENINIVFENVCKYFDTLDISYYKLAGNYEDNVDKLKIEMIENHISRLNSGLCKQEVGAYFYGVASDCERISDHLVNVNKIIFNKIGYKNQ
jgi:phosphate:Na+ symporter